MTDAKDPDTTPDRPRELPIDRELVAMAMEDHSEVAEYWFDTETGQIEVIPEELAYLDPYDTQGAARIRREAGDELLFVLRGIHGGGTRYEAVPQIESREMYRLMSRFAAGVDAEPLRGKLEVALDGRGAFGRFKRVLSEYPEHREAWFRMREAFIDERRREWLAELGVVQAEGARRPRSDGR